MSTGSDSGSLPRFLTAQTPAYDQALAELRAGRKQTHWIWFIFPQLAGLGESEMSRRYAIRDLHEARASSAYPVAGSRPEHGCHGCRAARGEARSCGTEGRH